MDKEAEFSEEWLEDVLGYYPFGGDDTDATQLSDKMVTTRKPARCHTCDEEIPVGSRARSLRERNNEVATGDHVFGTFRFCMTCCDAMAASWTDDGEAIDARHSLGERHRAERSK